MVRRTKARKLTEEEYLRLEETADFRHEYVNGFVFAMTGATQAHGIICGNIFAVMHSHLRGSSCQVYMNDMKAKIEKANCFYYPDVMVSCEPFEAKGVFKANPVIIIEVLSPGTAQIDKREKLIAYQMIKELREYFIVYQDRQRVDVFRRLDEEHWDIVTATAGEDMVLESMPNGPLSIPLSVIYERFSPPRRVNEEEASYEADDSISGFALGQTSRQRKGQMN